MTGHLGYFSNNRTDYDDYYVFSIPQNWDTLYVRTDSDASLELDSYLYNTAGTIVASAGVLWNSRNIKVSKCTGWNILLPAYRWSGQGSYVLKVTNLYPGSPLTDVKKEEIENLPSAFSLYQNYPNPFNPANNNKVRPSAKFKCYFESLRHPRQRSCNIS
jgi:hypothetical protein